MSSAAKAPRRTSTSALPRFKALAWEDYSVGIAAEVSRPTLERAVQRAAKAANNRLRRLEAAGDTKRAYAMAMRNMPSGRTRFKERTSSMTDRQLRLEYARLREFISAPTSTRQGALEVDLKRYETAVSKGFDGTFEEWSNYVDKYFGELKEQLFSSSAVYAAIIDGNTDLLDRMVKDYQAGKQTVQDEGSQLVSYLRRVRQREAARARRS